MRPVPTLLKPTAELLAAPVSAPAKQFDFHSSRVYRAIYEGRLKVLKDFGRLMIPTTEIEKFLSASRH